MTEEKIVMFDSDEAAKKVHDASGWMSRHGRFYGCNEHAARHDGCTHKLCECGAVIPKFGFMYCDSCLAERDKKKFDEMPRKKWDGETPLCIHGTDQFFFESCELYDYCHDNGVNPSELPLVICTPVHWRQIDESDFLDDMPEGIDWVPQSIQRAVKHLNEVILAEPPPAWEMGKCAAIMPEYSHGKTAEQGEG